ncbi:MAG: TonB-dependent receptor plug domain-containing protein [Candidatus Omnitrophica bacterium]|nr:TonB-dependent receptor plug domain-containing protein [Candidatus Omnitrophota bacterium]
MVRQAVSRGVLGCALAAAAGVLPALAQEEPVQVGTVLVSPRRIPGVFVNEGTVPANATVITAQDIAHSGAATIQEVLGRAEGVFVQDAQGFGLNSDSTVNLRGIVNSSRTNALVLMDGVRQNRFTGDEMHWQSVPLEAIDRIEIIRGGGGLVYGEGALAGVIRSTMPRPAGAPIPSPTASRTRAACWTATGKTPGRAIPRSPRTAGWSC